MSLFSATCKAKPIVHPTNVNIYGEVIGSIFSGNIEMSFYNDTEKLENFELIIGQSSSSKICLHDFKISLDNNLLSLTIMEKNEARRNYELFEEGKQLTSYGLGNDSYACINIPYVLPDQTVTVYAEYELPISFPTKSSIEFSFPLTYPIKDSNDEILQCDKFQFSCKFNSLPLKPNSITSNPEGKLNLETSTYTIKKLDSINSEICIQYDLNPPVYSDDLNDVRAPTKSYLFKDGISMSSDEYGSVTFIPTIDDNKDEIFGEEFIFVVDCSGSMKGKEIEMAGKCLIFFIKSLPENCFFNVIRFGSKFVPLFTKPVPNTDENSQKAIELGYSLEANLRGTVLSKPLEYVFSTPLSRKNKLRRVFVLTDGCVFDPKKVIDLVKKNSSTTMCNSIGIGYGVDKNLAKNIGTFGNGFIDFVLSGDDMRSKVINQLSKSINGLCKVDIVVENNPDIEIVPPLSETKLSPNEPTTFYFKSSQKLSDKINIRIDVEGKCKPIIIQMNSFSIPRAKKSFKYLFNNENLKYLRNLEQTEIIKKRIIELSIEYGILCPYTAFVGVQKYSSQKEKDRIAQLIEYHQRKEQEDKDKEYKKCQGSGSMQIFVRMNGKLSVIHIDPKATFHEFQKMVELKAGVPINMQRILYHGKQLNEDAPIESYGFKNNCDVHLTLRSRGGGYSPYPERTFCKTSDDDLVSIVSEQKVEGCWLNIPSFFTRSKNKNRHSKSSTMGWK